MSTAVVRPYDLAEFVTEARRALAEGRHLRMSIDEGSHIDIPVEAAQAIVGVLTHAACNTVRHGASRHLVAEHIFVDRGHALPGGLRSVSRQPDGPATRSTRTDAPERKGIEVISRGV